MKATDGAGLTSAVGTSPPFSAPESSGIAEIVHPATFLSTRCACYSRVLSPWSPGQLAAPATPKRSFTLKRSGLVAIRYDYLFGDPAGSIITTIDGKELFHATAAIDGVGRSVERTHYVFLAAGKHTLAFGVTGGQTLWLAGVTVGLKLGTPIP